MIQLTHESVILLGVAPADFRRGIDGFVSTVTLSLAQEPRSGTIFCFINRARTMIRALSYDGTGYWLMTKRLSKGRFTGWPSSDGVLSLARARELRQILGADTSWKAVASDGDTSASISTSALASGVTCTTVMPTPCTVVAPQSR